MPVTVDIQWREQYTSHALNRKFAGVIPAGIYRGFDAVAFTDGTVIVGRNDQEAGVAVMEVNGYSVTVRLEGRETVRVTSDRPYVVIDANYAIGVQTIGRIIAVAEPEPHQLVVCKGARANPDGTGSWSITTEERQKATWYDSNLDEVVIAQMAAAQVETMAKQLEIHERLFALENKE